MVCWFERHAGVEGGGRESPGMRVTFFRVAERKSPKKGRPPVCDPFAERRGKPAAGRLRGAPQNSLRCFAAPFGQLRRVSSRSMGASTPMPPHNRPAAGAASRGWTAEQPHGPLLRSAPPVQRVALAPARWGRAQQRPVWMSVGSPSRCAEERRAWGGMGVEAPVLRTLTRRGCPSGARSAKRVPRRAPRPSTAGCPQRSEGTQRVGSPFLW